jgi:hypothetical protein
VHHINNNDLFLISSINFDQGDGNSCPAKTIVVFAHMSDFSYAEPPELVSTMNTCLSLEDVFQHESTGSIPPIANKNQLQNYKGEPFLAHTVIFNTEC